MKYMIKVIYDSKYNNFIRINSFECTEEDLRDFIDDIEYDKDIIGYDIYKVEKEVRKDEISESSR